MNKTKFVAVAALVLAMGAIAQAGITGATCTQDNDGALTMNPLTDVTYDPAGYLGEPSLTVDEIQHWGPAHIYPAFEADGDPAAWILKDVVNQTNFDWTDYHFNIYMQNPYQITTSVQPLGWTATVTDPVLEENVTIDGVNKGALYHGAVDFFGGAPIVMGSMAEFGARLFWADGNGSFCIEQIPTPEPTALVLLLGGLAFLRRR